MVHRRQDRLGGIHKSSVYVEENNHHTVTLDMHLVAPVGVKARSGYQMSFLEDELRPCRCEIDGGTVD